MQAPEKEKCGVKWELAWRDSKKVCEIRPRSSQTVPWAATLPPSSHHQASSPGHVWAAEVGSSVPLNLIGLDNQFQKIQDRSRELNSSRTVSGTKFCITQHRAGEAQYVYLCTYLGVHTDRLLGKPTCTAVRGRACPDSVGPHWKTLSRAGKEPAVPRRPAVEEQECDSSLCRWLVIADVLACALHEPSWTGKAVEGRRQAVRHYGHGGHDLLTLYLGSRSLFCSSLPLERRIPLRGMKAGGKEHSFEILNSFFEMNQWPHWLSRASQGWWYFWK